MKYIFKGILNQSDFWKVKLVKYYYKIMN